MFSKFSKIITAIFTIALLTATIGCSNDSKYVTIETEALGTFAQIKCNTTITQSELTSLIHNIDTEAKNSMSIFAEDSLLSKINNNETDSLDHHLIYNIELAKRFNKLSGGAYDITIKPLTDAWGFGRNRATTEPNIDSIIQFVGHELISIDNNKIIKQDPRVQIDLNSIAKGYTVDLVANQLEALGIEDYMVNIGGEIRCQGYNPNKERWSIGIETPYDGNMAMDSFEKIVRIENKAVATSGNYRRFYLTEDGKKVVHTINPISGYSVVSGLLSATIVAPTCAEADAAATMFMSIGATADIEELAAKCEKEYGWKYYFIFASGNDYRIACSEEFK